MGSCGRLIRRMSVENPLWGAPRIHGELLKLGFDIEQSQEPVQSLTALDGPHTSCKIHWKSEMASTIPAGYWRL